MNRRRNNKESLAILADQYGMNPWSLVQTFAMESVVPAICTNSDCEEYSTETSPDCDGGFCNYCGQSNTMVSCRVLAGVI